MQSASSGRSGFDLEPSSPSRHISSAQSHKRKLDRNGFTFSPHAHQPCHLTPNVNRDPKSRVLEQLTFDPRLSLRLRLRAGRIGRLRLPLGAAITLHCTEEPERAQAPLSLMINSYGQATPPPTSTDQPPAPPALHTAERGREGGSSICVKLCFVLLQTEKTCCHGFADFLPPPIVPRCFFSFFSPKKTFICFIGTIYLFHYFIILSFPPLFSITF